MEEEKKYLEELQNYAEKVERNFDKCFSSQNYANLKENPHTMLLEGLMQNFDFFSIEDKDLEKVELYDFWKGENGRASKKR